VLKILGVDLYQSNIFKKIILMIIIARFSKYKDMESWIKETLNKLNNV